MHGATCSKDRISLFLLPRKYRTRYVHAWTLRVYGRDGLCAAWPESAGLACPRVGCVVCLRHTRSARGSTWHVSRLLLKYVADEMELLLLKTLVTTVFRGWQPRRSLPMKDTWGQPWCAGATFGIILQQAGCAPKEKLRERRQLKLELIKYNAS